MESFEGEKQQQRRRFCFWLFRGVLLLAVCALTASITVLAVVLAAQGNQQLQESRENIPTQTPGRQLKENSLPISTAHLVINLQDSRAIKNRRLDWFHKGVGRSVLGHGFTYGDTKLMVHSAGLYKIEVHMAVKCQDMNVREEVNINLIVHHCKAKSLTSAILTLPLHLSSTADKTVTAFMSVSSYLLAEQDVLFVTLTTDNDSSYSWSLDYQDFFFEVSKISEASN